MRQVAGGGYALRVAELVAGRLADAQMVEELEHDAAAEKEGAAAVLVVAAARGADAVLLAHALAHGDEHIGKHDEEADAADRSKSIPHEPHRIALAALDLAALDLRA